MADSSSWLSMLVGRAVAGISTAAEVRGVAVHVASGQDLGRAGSGRRHHHVAQEASERAVDARLHKRQPSPTSPQAYVQASKGHAGQKTIPWSWLVGGSRELYRPAFWDSGTGRLSRLFLVETETLQCCTINNLACLLPYISAPAHDTCTLIVPLPQLCFVVVRVV
jgi:hypothetical protein